MTDNNKQRFSVLVCSCDKYADTWRYFFDLVEKYWGDHSTNFYLSTETENFKYGSNYSFEIKVLNQKRRENWGGRIRQALEDIEENYVLLLLDDFFIKQDVRIDLLQELVNKMEADSQISSFQLAYSRYAVTNKNAILEDRIGSATRDGFRKTEFYPTLWRKSTLYKWLRPHETIWGFELCGDARARRWYKRTEAYRVYSPCILDYLWCAPDCSAIVNGKWFDSEALRAFFEKEKMSIPFEDRGFITYEEYAKRDLVYIIKKKGIRETIVRSFWRIVNYF